MAGMNPRTHRRQNPILFRFTCTVLIFAVVSPDIVLAQTRQRGTVLRQGPTLTGIEALRALAKSGSPKDTETFALHMLWEDIRQPEVLYLLAQAEERLRKPQDAGAYYALFLRVLDENEKSGGGIDVPPDVAKQKPLAERRLKALKQDDAAVTAAYSKKVTGKKFESPEQVDDSWMDNVKADLFGLHGLYAWKLVGGRKDAQPDWIHNTKGSMHRSGAKFVDEAEGRKSVLFTIPLKDKDSQDADTSNRDALAKLGHNSHLEARNVTGGKFLRIGARGYGFPLILKVSVDGKPLKSETVSNEAWSDLKFELPAAEKKARPAAAKKAAPARAAAGAPAAGTAQKVAAKPQAAQAPAEGQLVVVELIVPEGQKWSEGVWIDYLDFFDN